MSLRVAHVCVYVRTHPVSCRYAHAFLSCAWGGGGSVQQKNDIVANVHDAIESYKRAHGGLPSSTVMLAHDNFTNLLLPDVRNYIKSLGYQFITLNECRERCIDRAFPGQPAHLADHRGCWDPRNPSDYVASQLYLGQWWLKTVPVSTDKIPGPLGTNYAFMPPPTVPYIAPTIVPGVGTPPPAYMTVAPTTTGTTAAPTTTHAPTTAAPTTAAPTTVAPSPSGPCTVTGTTLTVLSTAAAGIACMDIYNAQYHFLAANPVTAGKSTFAATVLNGATSLNVELYANAGCSALVTSFTCTVTTAAAATTTPTNSPTTAAPTTAAPTTASPSGVPSFPSSGLGCVRSGSLVYIYNLPTSSRCVQGYNLPTYKLQADVSVTPPPTYVALANIAPGTSLAIEVYSQRAGPGDCSGLLGTFSCQG